MTESQRPCPLCGGALRFFHRDKAREYGRCNECSLVSVPPSMWLTESAEKTEYDLHENIVTDEGYRRFLNRLAAPLLERLPQGSAGLDFGCGPGPALARMMEEAGHEMSVYDKFYAPEEKALSRQYDFITATEVVEHLHNPAETLALLWSCLKAGGTLAIMTKLAMDEAAFARWHYKADRTHIVFFQSGYLFLACTGMAGKA